MSKNETEENHPCQNCFNVPDEYIQLACEHNFCLECLAYTYLNYLNGMDEIEEKQIVQLPCHICQNITELDQQSIETLQNVLQNILDQQEEVKEVEQSEDQQQSEDNQNNEDSSSSQNLQDQRKSKEIQNKIEQDKQYIKSFMQNIDVNQLQFQLNEIQQDQQQIQYDQNKFQKTLQQFQKDIQEKIEEKISLFNFQNSQKIQNNLSYMNSIQDQIKQKLSLYQASQQKLKSNNEHEIKHFIQELKDSNLCQSQYNIKLNKINFDSLRQQIQYISDLVDHLDMDSFYHNQSFQQPLYNIKKIKENLHQYNNIYVSDSINLKNNLIKYKNMKESNFADIKQYETKFDEKYNHIYKSKFSDNDQDFDYNFVTKKHFKHSNIQNISPSKFQHSYTPMMNQSKYGDFGYKSFYSPYSKNLPGELQRKLKYLDQNYYQYRKFDK